MEDSVDCGLAAPIGGSQEKPSALGSLERIPTDEEQGPGFRGGWMALWNGTVGQGQGACFSSRLRHSRMDGMGKPFNPPEIPSVKRGT